MKRIFALIAVLSLVLLCGCFGDEPVEVSTVSAPDVTAFAPTTLCDTDVLTVRLLSATPLPNADGTEGIGLSYRVGFKNKTDGAIDVSFSAVTVNGQAVPADRSFSIEKNAGCESTFPLEAAVLEQAGIKSLDSVGLHLTVTSKDSWWLPTLLERDLVFYPSPQTTATATATAVAANP